MSEADALHVEIHLVKWKQTQDYLPYIEDVWVVISLTENIDAAIPRECEWTQSRN